MRAVLADRQRVHPPARHQPVDEGLVLVRRVEVEHDAAADERRRQLPLLVGGDDDQRQTLRRAMNDPMAERRHGEAAVAENLEQGVGNVRVGLVDLVDEKHRDRATFPHFVHRLPEAPGLDVLLVGDVEAALDLGVRQAFDEIDTVEQIQRLEPGMDDLDQRFPVSEMRRRRTGDLALAAAGLAADEQRPAGGPGQDQRVDLRLVPQVAGRRETGRSTANPPGSRGAGR